MSEGDRKRDILDAAMRVFGRYGFQKTSVDDIAAAAKMSKQGLYLHFESKQAIFVAALARYLDEGLALVDAALARPDATLFEKLSEAMDAWFGRHIETFAPQSFDILAIGPQLSAGRDEAYRDAFRARIAKALKAETHRRANVCSEKELAEALFVCGLTWKEDQPTRAEFRKRMAVCIRAICQIDRTARASK